MVEAPTVRFLRIVRELERLREKYQKKNSAETSILHDCCLLCYVKGGENVWLAESQPGLWMSGKPEGFWEEALHLLEKEGLGVGLQAEIQKRMKPDYCKAFSSDWILDWVAQQVK